MNRATHLALVALALIVAYHLQRYAAAHCVGGGCDIYIPISLLLPLLSWAAAIASGVAASQDARHSHWFALLTACTAIGLFGPVVILLLLRDNPDATVA